MTTEILRSALVRRVGELREKSIRALRLCKFTPATSNDKGGVIQPTSVEEIALRANECNAWIEACDGFLAMVEAESKKILQPEQAQQATSKKKARKFYE